VCVVHRLKGLRRQIDAAAVMNETSFLSQSLLDGTLCYVTSTESSLLCHSEVSYSLSVEVVWFISYSFIARLTDF